MPVFYGLLGGCLSASALYRERSLPTLNGENSRAKMDEAGSG